MVIEATAVEPTSQAAGLPCVSVGRLSADTLCSQVCAGWAALPVQTLQRALQQRRLTCCKTRSYLALFLHQALTSNPSASMSP